MCSSARAVDRVVVFECATCTGDFRACELDTATSPRDVLTDDAVGEVGHGIVRARNSTTGRPRVAGDGAVVHVKDGLPFSFASAAFGNGCIVADRAGVERGVAVVRAVEPASIREGGVIGRRIAADRAVIEDRGAGQVTENATATVPFRGRAIRNDAVVERGVGAAACAEDTSAAGSRAIGDREAADDRFTWITGWAVDAAASSLAVDDRDRRSSLGTDHDILAPRTDDVVWMRGGIGSRPDEDLVTDVRVINRILDVIECRGAVIIDVQDDCG